MNDLPIVSFLALQIAEKGAAACCYHRLLKLHLIGCVFSFVFAFDLVVSFLLLLAPRLQNLISIKVV